LLISKHEDNRGDKGNKDGMGAVLYAERSGGGIEEQPIG